MKNPQWKTLIAMSLVTLVLCSYAFYPDDLKVFGIALKKLDVSTLTSLMAEADVDKGVEIKADTATTPPVKPLGPDTTKQKMLLIGDSMTEGLSPAFCNYAEANGHDHYSVIWYSSSVQRWGESQTLDYFLEQVKPGYIIICLGSNELFVKDLPQRDKYIKKILKKIGNIPYVWIGPPNWKPDTGINRVIMENVGKERFFDSSQLKLQRRSDHAHPTKKAAAYWFDLVAEWMQSTQCAHSVKMAKPDKKVKHTNFKLLQPEFEGY